MTRSTAMGKNRKFVIIIQWTPLNVITFVNTKNDNNNRLITLTEKMKIAIL